MDFLYGESVVLGVCVDLSESGLRGTFSKPLPPDCSGLLTLYHDGHKFETQARIDSASEEETRVSFEFHSDKERNALSKFLKLLGSRSSSEPA